MPLFARRARRWALVLALVASVVLGVLIVWLFAPAAFKALHTDELAGLLGLLLLPPLTAWMVVADRRASRAWGRPTV